ncbi:hypothetical protein HMPREF3034_01655 [Prevotella sp. DNF00663]|uniref:hypothetical protein n=1 Tax=Prevotella sp. DNF00663 TaxID=1384078 RepID=UPI0007808A94|nr:hypothetical protein [Prevotella sp. DNF00663]KXB82386.1 hypothetical protein HMPREF3034_01655 [Prevotella sp. DNF00663]
MKKKYVSPTLRLVIVYVEQHLLQGSKGKVDNVIIDDTTTGLHWAGPTIGGDDSEVDPDL